MSQHLHSEFHDWCYRCHLSRDEVRDLSEYRHNTVEESMEKAVIAAKEEEDRAT